MNPHLSAPSRILVRTPNWIGDQILAYPFFHFLRREFPRAHIAVACLPWVQSVQFRNLVNEVIVLPRPRDRSLGARWEALETGAEKLKNAGPWDLGITLANSFSSAWHLFRSGVPRRRGFSTDGRGLLLNERVKWKPCAELHRADAYLQLLPGTVPSRPASEFWGEPPENDLDPGIPGVIPRFEPDKAWPEIDCVEPPDGDYWVLAPGSVAESRRWPVERFAALAREIASTRGWKGVVVGGPSESPIADALCSDRSLNLIDRTARGSVASLWKVFRLARFAVCNDSGLAHVASLCGAPVQVVWGAGNPKRTRPIGPGKTRLIFNPVACWPCEKNVCLQPDGRKLECLNGIEPESVFKEITDGLKP